LIIKLQILSRDHRDIMLRIAVTAVNTGQCDLE